MTTHDHDVAIIGAGPYGLSIAAHLAPTSVNFRIFGPPMHTWRTAILRDSHLKSDGFASSLYEPTRRFTLRSFCNETNQPYADTGLPVPCATFIEYGMAFQQRFVPTLDQRTIVEVKRAGDAFTLRADDGEIMSARRVVMATGLGRFGFMPPPLAALGPEFATHSSAYSTVERFAGRDVIVIGAGASALDLAKELLAEGATVRIVARGSEIVFHDPPVERSAFQSILAPSTGLGPGWKSLFCTELPVLFHALPESLRVRVVRRHLGPSGCWFTRDPVQSKAGFLLEREVREATAEGGRVRLTLARVDGSGAETVETDHVIAATGYRVDLARLGCLPEELRREIRLCDTSPALSTDFESSVPGLYFVGLAAANSFGPLLRFAFGARFAAERLSAHLTRTAARRPALREPAPA